MTETSREQVQWLPIEVSQKRRSAERRRSFVGSLVVQLQVFGSLSSVNGALASTFLGGCNVMEMVPTQPSSRDHRVSACLKRAVFFSSCYVF